jgi:GxxExxY protein
MGKHFDVTQEYDALANAVSQAAERVFSTLGPDHLEEEVYEKALELEIRALQIDYQRQATIAVRYRDTVLATLRPDFMLYLHDDDPEARVILSYPFVLEVKKLSSALGRAEFAQLRRYMQITGAAAGCLINFPNYKDVVEIETALPGQKFSRVTERA